MELQTITKQIAATETVFDDFDERPVDCDFVLPDYLPDIAAILKCIMKPVVQTHQISGDRVMADGIVSLQILYLDEDRKCIRSFESAQPFSSVFTVKDLGGGDRVRLSSKVNYVNCRATGPRRVDIHGAFSVKLNVQSETDHAVIESVENKDVCTQSHPVSYSKVAAFAQKILSVNEVVELENGGNAEVLIRTEAMPSVTDCKLMNGKAVIKGEILLKTVYVTNTTEGTMGHSENVILFSQIVDADGLSEECLCSCKADLLLCEAHPTQNPGGENKLLSFTGKLMLTLEAYRDEHCTILTDAYHTRYPLKTESKRLSPARITSIVCETAKVPLTLELPDADVRSVADLWCELNTVSCRCEPAGTFTDGQVLVCMLAGDSHGLLSYYERPIDFTLTHPEVCDRMTANLTILNCDPTVSGNRMDLQLTIAADRTCMVVDDCVGLCGMSTEGSAPYVKGEGMERCCMKVYFAGAGESLWEIAKAQHVSVDELRAENDLSGDVLDADTMLLFTLS